MSYVTARLHDDTNRICIYTPPTLEAFQIPTFCSFPLRLTTYTQTYILPITSLPPPRLLPWSREGARPKAKAAGGRGEGGGCNLLTYSVTLPALYSVHTESEYCIIAICFTDILTESARSTVQVDWNLKRWTSFRMSPSYPFVGPQGVKQKQTRKQPKRKWPKRAFNPGNRGKGTAQIDRHTHSHTETAAFTTLRRRRLLSTATLELLR